MRGFGVHWGDATLNIGARDENHIETSAAGRCSLASGGGASCNPCPFPVGDISVAHVHAKAGWAEDWQTPAFDEYVLVLKGTIKIVTAHGETKVSGGQAVFLPKGERVQWVFEEEAEYVPICLPAFSPSNVHREEAGDKPPVHDSHTTIYHLVQKPLWEETKAKGGVYYPPTYEEDGFTHATADPKYLIGVANHFYKETKAEWICLKMTRASLAQAGITLKFESPSPVGACHASRAGVPAAHQPHDAWTHR